MELDMMKKYITKLVSTMRIEWAVVWMLVVCTVAMGELDVIPNGEVPPDTPTEKLVNIGSVILTIVAVPLALRLFALGTTRGLRRMDYDEALRAYHAWGVVRLLILTAVTIGGMVTYYLTLSSVALLCALVALCVSFSCWPTGGRVRNYLEVVNEDR